MAREIKYQLYIAWDGTTYVDESSRFIRANGEIRYAPIEESISTGRGIVDIMTVTLDNATSRYSPMNTAGALYTYIQDGKAYHAPVYLNVSIDDGASYFRLFTGVIKIPKEKAPTMKEGATVEIDCRSRDELLMQKRLSTTLANFRTYHDSGYTESSLMAAWLVQAGFSSGDYTLDAGTQRIDWAWLDDESPLEEMWSLAAACGGRFFADNTGEFVYENVGHWLTATRSATSQETLTESGWQRLTPEYDDKELYNVVTVEASPRVIAAQDILWEPDETIYIPADSTKKVVARMRQPAYYIADAVYGASSGGGTNLTSDISIAQVNYAQRVELTITNANVLYGAYLRPLQILGQAVGGAPTQEETRTSAEHGNNSAFFTSVRGGRTRSIRGNVYIQFRDQAGALAEMLINRLEWPRLSFKVNGVPGIERYLGDRITIDDSSIMSAPIEVLIVGINWRLSKDSGYAHDIDAIDASNLYPFATTTPGYFRIGTNELGAADPQNGRVFY